MIQARSELLRRERLKSQLLSTISPIVKEGGGKSLGSMENKKKRVECRVARVIVLFFFYLKLAELGMITEKVFK